MCLGHGLCRELGNKQGERPPQPLGQKRSSLPRADRTASGELRNPHFPDCRHVPRDACHPNPFPHLLSPLHHGSVDHTGIPQQWGHRDPRGPEPRARPRELWFPGSALPYSVHSAAPRKGDSEWGGAAEEPLMPRIPAFPTQGRWGLCFCKDSDFIPVGPGSFIPRTFFQFQVLRLYQEHTFQEKPSQVVGKNPTFPHP